MQFRRNQTEGLARRGPVGAPPGLPACLAAALAFLLVLSGPAGAGEIVGKPRVIDGDTLDFSGRIVRLFGIDAPEIEQTCRAAGRTWPCGKEARWAAINRVSPHWVTCVDKGRASDGATLAICYLAGAGQWDFNAWMVAQGWALADRLAGEAYIAEEQAARAAGRGLWRGAFVPPWDWRRGRRLGPE
jgi:endonuclease YncB( thermonuclease family)